MRWWFGVGAVLLGSGMHVFQPKISEAQPPAQSSEEADVLSPPKPPAPSTPAPPTTPNAEPPNPSSQEPETPQTPPPSASSTESATDAMSPPDAAPTSDAATPTPSTPLRVIAIDAEASGVAPVVGRAVTDQMRKTAEAMGYEVVSAADTIAAAQRLRMPYPPSPADLWRVTFVAQAQRGAFARVWAHEGQYVTEISVASLDGAGPFFARGASGADDLKGVVERLIRQALPAPTQWNAEEAKRLTQQTQSATQADAPEPLPVPKTQLRIVPISRMAALRPTRRWDLALQTEAAFGTSSDFFYNHLAGLRLGFRITRNILIGAYYGYANLRGRDNREHNMLSYFQIEHRIRLTQRSDITVPVRFGVGYVPFNGPMFRLAAGLNIPIASRVELGFDLFTPTFWILPDRTTVSLNVGTEVIFRL